MLAVEIRLRLEREAVQVRIRFVTSFKLSGDFGSWIGVSKPAENLCPCILASYVFTALNLSPALHDCIEFQHPPLCFRLAHSGRTESSRPTSKFLRPKSGPEGPR